MRRWAVIALALAACAHTPAAAPRRTSARPESARAAQSAGAGDAPSVVVVTREQSREVSLIDPRTMRSTQLDVGMTTQGAASDGTTAALTSPDTGTVALLDGAGPRVRKIAGLARPHDAAFLPGNRLAVTEEGATDVALIDTSSARVVGRIPVGARPHNVTSDGDRLVVTLPELRTVALIDAAGSVRRVALGERPHACLTRGSSIWCVTYDAPHLLVLRAGKVVARRTLGSYPHHLLSSPAALLVADPTAGAVWTLDASGRVTAEEKVAAVQEMAWVSGGVWVVSQAGYVVTSTGRRVSVSGKPHALALIG